jgi:hypothetical protein
MPYSLFQTTAEEIIGASDSVLQKRTGIDAAGIADFLTTNPQYAENAAKMAVELGFATFDAASNLYLPRAPFANYLVTSDTLQKGAVLRFVLEQYEPYQFFKNRLRITGFATDAAATQTRATLGITADRMEIANTLINLGTYTGSLTHLGGGRYEANTTKGFAFLEAFAAVIADREDARIIIRGRLGEDVFGWIDTVNVFEPLVDGLLSCGNAKNDSRPPIIHSANAVESFLVQVGNHYPGVVIAGKNGIISKANEIINTRHHLTTKHFGLFEYLGHVRNASDHGMDPNIGAMWTISAETALEYFQVSLSAIRSAYDCIHGNYIV